jgi:hypothetical protein
MTTPTTSAVDRRTFTRSYPGERGQPRMVRAALALLLEGCPRADDAVLITSELAANAVVHSNSGAPGGRFTIGVEVHYGDYVWIEVQDQGGPWIRRADRDGEVHGLDLVDALAGAGNWGIDGDPEHGHITWVRVDWPTGCPAGRKHDTAPGADRTRRCA